jgi:hypothetical protein
VANGVVAIWGRKMIEAKLSRLTQWATVVGAVVTAATMFFGVSTYRRGVHEQRQAAAVGTLQEYLKMSVEYPDLARRVSGQPLDARYEWFATHAVFTAETLWTQVGSDRPWRGTIDFILRQHRDYLQSGALSCDAYQPTFVEYMKEQVPKFKCGQ